MDDGILIASIASNAGSQSCNPPHSAFSNGKVSTINMDLEFTRYHVTNAGECLNRKAEASSAEDSMNGEAGIGKFGDSWVIADMVGRISYCCKMLIYRN